MLQEGESPLSRALCAAGGGAQLCMRRDKCWGQGSQPHCVVPS